MTTTRPCIYRLGQRAAEDQDNGDGRHGDTRHHMMMSGRIIASEKLLRTTAATEPIIAPKERAIRVEHRPISETAAAVQDAAKMSRPT